MKSVILSFLIASLFLGSAIAQDLGNSRELPVKNTPIVTYEPPAVPRQGGDTIADATVIPSLPYSNTGTTAGYLDDYDEICPYDTPGSPDVVYSFTPDSDDQISVDLCGSSYDTKVYIYDESLTLIACNDDAYFGGDPCGMYVSIIENTALIGGNTYYIVIDGYGGESGNYILGVEEYEPCMFVGCPADAVDEGEPPLEDCYTDLYNGGCSSSPEPDDYFQEINWTNVDPSSPWNGHAWLCGASGWFFCEGASYRDTDYFRVYALQAGMMEVTVESEHPLNIFKLAPLDCVNVGIELSATADCEAPATLTFPVTAGEEIWLFTAPTTFEGPVTEFLYFMTVSNNTFDTVPAEGMSWGGVKSLYR